MEKPLRWIDLMAMDMTQLAQTIEDNFNHKPQTHITDWNGIMLGNVWKARFGHFPTLGEIDVILKK